MKTKRKFSSDKPNLGKSIPKKMNPFEIHINRSKHQVLGRKLKSDQGLPGISKNKAIQKVSVIQNVSLVIYTFKFHLSSKAP